MIVLLMAGCAEQVTEESEPVLAQPVEPAINATPLPPVEAPQPTADDGFSLPLQASATGALAGYRVPVPNGTLVSAWYDASVTRPVMEIMLLGDGTIDGLYVMLMAADGDVLEEIIQRSGDGTGFPSGPGDAGVGVNEWSTSTRVRTSDYATLSGVAEGDDLYVVVGALGGGDATIGLRYLESDPVGSDYIPSQDVDEFTSRVDGMMWTGEPLGQGDGLSLSFFYDRFSISTAAWSRMTAGDVVVDEPIPATPARAATALTVSVPEHDAGYASVATLVWTQVHAGIVELDLTAPGGQTASGTQVIVADPIVGTTIGLVRGEGTGTATASLTVDAVGAPTIFPQLIFMVQVSMTPTISELTGIAVEDTERPPRTIPNMDFGDDWISVGF